MSTFSTVLMSLFAVAFIGATVDACGMPPAPPPAPMYDFTINNFIVFPRFKNNLLELR